MWAVFKGVWPRSVNSNFIKKASVNVLTGAEFIFEKC